VVRGPPGVRGELPEILKCSVRKTIILARIFRYSGKRPDAVIDDSLGWIPFW